MAKQLSYAYDSKHLNAMGAIRYTRLRCDHQETFDKLLELSRNCTVATKFRGAGSERIRQYIDKQPEWMRPYLFTAIDRYSRGAVFLDAKQISAPAELPNVTIKGLGTFYTDTPVHATRIDHIRVHHGYVFLGYNFSNLSPFDYTIYPDTSEMLAKYEQWFAKKFKGVPNDMAAGQRWMTLSRRQFRVGDTKWGPHSLIVRALGSFGLPRDLNMDGVTQVAVFAYRRPENVDAVEFRLRIL